jgi:hypothetical protein
MFLDRTIKYQMTIYWDKPGFNQEEFYRDSYQCEKDRRQSYFDENESPFPKVNLKIYVCGQKVILGWNGEFFTVYPLSLNKNILWKTCQTKSRKWCPRTFIAHIPVI